MDELLQAMRAAGESSRLRILLALAPGELTVGELCRVLEQSQPRVSRHLKLLCDAGLLVRHAEGASAFYRLAPSGSLGRDLLDAVLPMADVVGDAVLQRDAQRLETVQADRAAEAASYFEANAADWDDIRSRHVAERNVETAMLAAVGRRQIGTLLDIGTGTGRILEVFAERVESGLGIDLSAQMLKLARVQLDRAGLGNCTVRHGNVYDLAVPDGSVDVAVLHHVLHFLDDPATAIAEAARTLGRDGRLLVVDFAPHGVEALRTEHAHRRLGFAESEVVDWLTAAGLSGVSTTHFPPASDDDETLTVTLWCATQHQAVSTVPPDRPAGSRASSLEQAS